MHPCSSSVACQGYCAVALSMIHCQWAYSHWLPPVSDDGLYISIDSLSQVVRERQRGLLQWRGGRSDVVMTRWWSCLKSTGTTCQSNEADSLQSSCSCSSSSSSSAPPVFPYAVQLHVVKDDRTAHEYAIHLDGTMKMLMPDMNFGILWMVHLYTVWWIYINWHLVAVSLHVNSSAI